MATKMISYEANLEKALAILDLLPRWAANQQGLSIDLYRQLAQGKPVSPESLAESLGISTGEVTSLLEHQNVKGHVLYDHARRIVGFRGLSLAPTHHRLEVDGRTLFAWCAMDTLFMSEVLGKRVRVESPCPHSGRLISLTLTPAGVEVVEPAETVVSFLCGDAWVLETNAAKIIATFCHYIFFLASPESGAAWTAERPRTVLLTLEQALEWGRRFNAAQLGDALASRTTAV
jgi:alkylmercury lyase